MKKITTLLLLISGIFIGSSGLNAQAADHSNANIQYSVNKISPGNEVDASSSFYDLKVKPGQTRRIQARIRNATAKQITVKSKFFTTFTNNSGQIAYTQAAKKDDTSLQNKISDFTEIKKGDEQVTIPAKGSRVVTATIKVPQSATGVMLGSWYFEKTNQNAGKPANGININHKYSYALAVKLTTKEISHPKLTLGTVTPGLKNYRKAVLATIHNPRPAVMNQLSVKTEVTQKGATTVLFKNTSQNLIMAPNSHFQYPTFLDKQPMKAGDYTLNMTVTTKDAKWPDQTWQWSKSFTITNEQARQNNRQAKNDPDVPISIWWYVAGVVLIAAISAGIVYLLMNRKRRQ
ncbi:DUF916 and DUF3324 domain-containing protein [Levilactobacillus brevis]|uniref:DUF916 and DUF3324 domain-containing protein n=1 Tax=Levilactobacillus brevis TaxID=1580 RepID=UPI001BDECCB6|nr:DUF916 and DUF3324 domain-containing protein [Levilactobacillus brevis]